MDIAPLLHIGPGVTALIGGGGKTTLMDTLAAELRRRGTVIVTTSTHIRRPADYPVLTSGDEKAVSAALARSGAVCVAAESVEGKLTAPALPFEALSALADFVLVEADGAKRLPLKAHAPHEPVIPAGACQTICVVGASGFGRPIARAAHRPELYSQIAGVSPETRITPEMEGAVLTGEALHDRIYVNQVERDQDRKNAAGLAELLQCPVLAGSLQKGEYFVC